MKFGLHPNGEREFELLWLFLPSFSKIFRAGPFVTQICESRYWQLFESSENRFISIPNFKLPPASLFVCLFENADWCWDWNQSTVWISSRSETLKFWRNYEVLGFFAKIDQSRSCSLKLFKFGVCITSERVYHFSYPFFFTLEIVIVYNNFI